MRHRASDPSLDERDNSACCRVGGRRLDKPKRALTAMVFFCLLLFSAASVYAQEEPSGNARGILEPLELSDEEGVYPLGLHLEILEDADKVWTIEDVMGPELTEHFVPSEMRTPNFGYTESAYWVRFRVKDNADERVQWLLQVDASLFYIDLYLTGADGQIAKSVHTGSMLPLDTRDVEHPDYLFDLDLSAGAERTVYLHFQSETVMLLRLSVLSAATAANKGFVDRTIEGFIIGMLLIMIGYNLILSLYLRDSSYLFFALFLTGNLVLHSWWYGSIGHQFFWPQSRRLAALTGQLPFVVTMIFALLFTNAFLVAKDRAPRLSKLMKMLVLAYLVLLPVQFFNSQFTAGANILLTVISYFTIVLTGIIVWRRGHQSARFFVLAWLLWLTSSAFYVSSLTGLIPFTFLAEAGQPIGLMILTLSLSLALIDRINILRQEREMAQLEVVRQQQEAIRLKDEFAATLQTRVDERTADLTVARDEAEEARQHELARRRVAEGLSDVIAALNSDDSLVDILGLISIRSQTLLRADDVLICNLDTATETVTVRSGSRSDSGQGGQPLFSLDFANLSQVLISDQPTPLTDTTNRLLTPDVTYNGLLAVPISSETTSSSGCMLFYYDEPPSLSADEFELAALFAAQAALAIESAELRRQAAETAVSGERDRIARDLHDSVTQALFSASLIAEALPGVWERRPEMALSSLQELRSLTQGALAEMRSLLLELRPGELAHRKLGELLRQLADGTSARTDLPITVSITGDCLFPQDVQIALYRIAQEALNNVIKHARASRATVSLDCSEANVVLIISDDGRGIDPKSNTPHRHGLNIMRERAEEIGARSTINSELGEGTEVTVKWRPAAKDS